MREYEHTMSRDIINMIPLGPIKLDFDIQS